MEELGKGPSTHAPNYAGIAAGYCGDGHAPFGNCIRVSFLFMLLSS